MSLTTKHADNVSAQWIVNFVDMILNALVSLSKTGKDRYPLTKAQLTDYLLTIYYLSQVPLYKSTVKGVDFSAYKAPSGLAGMFAVPTSIRYVASNPSWNELGYGMVIEDDDLLDVATFNDESYAIDGVMRSSTGNMVSIPRAEISLADATSMANVVNISGSRMFFADGGKYTVPFKVKGMDLLRKGIRGGMTSDEFITQFLAELRKNLTTKQ